MRNHFLDSLYEDYGTFVCVWFGPSFMDPPSFTLNQGCMAKPTKSAKDCSGYRLEQGKLRLGCALHLLVPWLNPFRGFRVVQTYKTSKKSNANSAASGTSRQWPQDKIAYISGKQINLLHRSARERQRRCVTTNILFEWIEWRLP